jgi:hypothetical protein
MSESKVCQAGVSGADSRIRLKIASNRDFPAHAALRELRERYRGSPGDVTVSWPVATRAARTAVWMRS